MSSAKYQYVAAFVVNLFVIGFGLNSGWTSPSIILLQSNDTPLPSGKITTEEASWIASLMGLGAFPGALIGGFIMERLGRKWTLISFSIPMVIGWFVVIFAQSVYYLYVARVMHGFVCGGIIVISPVFLTEIANDSIRGILGSTVILSAHFGVALAFIFGNYLTYNTSAIFMIVLSVLFAVLFFFFPETPTFLVKQNKIDEAEKSIQFYQNLREEEKGAIQLEIDSLMRAINGDDIKQDAKHSLKWSDLVTKPGSKALIIGIVLILLNQFGGCYAMMVYTATIFEMAGSNLTPNMSAMIVAIIQFVGTIVMTCLVDRVGRKILYVVSTLGAALGLITMGIYMTLKYSGLDSESFNWVPLAALSAVIFFASCAILTLPFTVIAEVMTENIKDFGVTFCMTLMSTLGFIVLKFFPLFMELVGFHISMFIFAGVCLSSAVFITLYMPETKGKSYEEIMNSLR